MPESLAFVKPPEKKNGDVPEKFDEDSFATVRSGKTCPRWLVVLTISGIILAVLISVMAVYFVKRDPERPDPIQGWGDWSIWSSCSVSCGQGSKVRSRECHQPIFLCLGNKIQAATCYSGGCPRKEYGLWTTWQSWSSCTKTCGTGVQNRQRICEKQLNQTDCIGPENQIRECSTWSCPSCDRWCPSGGVVLPPTCSRCVCVGNTFKGHVKGITNLPLENVEIMESKLPNVVITRTDMDGNYTLLSACHGVSLLLRLPGYSEKHHIMSSWNKVTVMEKFTPLNMYQEPEDKVRLVGDSVQFCCEASGSPPPDYYEWFHNGRFLDEEFYQNDSKSLMISALTLYQGGRYKCRASNDISATYSSEAHLEVKNSSGEFCLKIPLSHILKLPSGCNYHGLQKIDIGRCKKGSCAMSEDIGDQQCGKDTDSCCDITKYEKVNIQCNAFVLPYKIAKECGCGKCTSLSPQISGTVLDSSTKEPIPFVKLSVNNVHVASSNKYGYFSFALQNKTTNVPIEAQDTSRQYSPSTKVKHIPLNSNHLLFVKILMIKRQLPIDISSDEDNVISIGNSLPFGHILLPKNSIYDMNGHLFQGRAEAFVNALNPRNHTDYLACPGELGYADNEGNIQRLQTFGMFSLDLQDKATKTLLQLRGNIQVAFDSSNSRIVPKLWTLDPGKGIWQFQGKMSNRTDQNNLLRAINNMHQTDTVIIGDVPVEVGRTWTNFDSDSDRACHSKIRVFLTNEMLPEDQRKGIEITALTVVDENENIAEVSNIRAWSDEGDDNGYCIVHLCETFSSPGSGYHGYLIAEAASTNPMPGEESIRLLPARVGELKWDDELINDLAYDRIGEGDNSAVEIKFKLESDVQNGPFYNWSGEYDDLKKWAYSEDCSNADESGNYFAFYALDEGENPCRDSTIPIEEVTLQQNKSENYRAWFSKSLQTVFDVCYVKVMISNGNTRNFSALSNVGIFSYDDPIVPEGSIFPGNTTYGITTDCPVNATETGVCLEIKHGGVLSSGDPDDPEAIDDTLIDVYGVDEESGGTSDKCTVTQIRTCLKEYVGEYIYTTEGDNNFKMRVVHSMSNGPDFGIFCGQAESPSIVRHNVYTECMKNDFSTTTCQDDADGKGWALKMKCDP